MSETHYKCNNCGGGPYNIKDVGSVLHIEDYIGGREDDTFYVCEKCERQVVKDMYVVKCPQFMVFVLDINNPDTRIVITDLAELRDFEKTHVGMFKYGVYEGQSLNAWDAGDIANAFLETETGTKNIIDMNRVIHTYPGLKLEDMDRVFKFANANGKPKNKDYIVTVGWRGYQLGEDFDSNRFHFKNDKDLLKVVENAMNTQGIPLDTRIGLASPSPPFNMKFVYMDDDDLSIFCDPESATCIAWVVSHADCVKKVTEYFKGETEEADHDEFLFRFSKDQAQAELKRVSAELDLLAKRNKSVHEIVLANEGLDMNGKAKRQKTEK